MGCVRARACPACVRMRVGMRMQWCRAEQASGCALRALGLACRRIQSCWPRVHAIAHRCAQVRELEARLVASTGERESLAGRLAAQEAATAAAAAKADEADQRLAAKARGFALLRADFAAQRVEVEEVTRTNGKLLARWGRRAWQLGALDGGAALPAMQDPRWMSVRACPPAGPGPHRVI
mgnify:CR=1 FL=1